MQEIAIVLIENLRLIHSKNSQLGNIFFQIYTCILKTMCEIYPAIDWHPIKYRLKVYYLHKQMG